MSVRSNLTNFAKRLAKPVLLPVLLKAGWRPRVPVPRITASDRLREDEVASRVSVRADQTILVNGAPFFPIGLYYVRDEIADVSGAGLRRLRAMGFNTIFFDGGLQSEQELDRIWEAGLRVWYRPPGELFRDFDVLKQVIAKFGRHPAILFWEMDDEPVLNRLEIKRAEIGRQVVKQMDPFHPILCNQWLANLDQAAEMRRWGRLADVYACSIYPVPLWRWENRLSLVERGWPHSVAVVGQQTEFWGTLAPGKPIIPVLQAWAFDALEDGEAAYPTYQECRFMAYQAVIRGAKGLHHYGAVDTSRPIFACGLPPRLHADLERTHADFVKARAYNEWFWSYYAKVINELSRMGSVFAAPDAAWRPEFRESLTNAKANGIECRVKQYRDSSVVLLVNATNAPVSVAAFAAEWSGRELLRWGQGSALQVSSGGAFQDVLEPYGVRVYSDQPDLLAD